MFFGKKAVILSLKCVQCQIIFRAKKCANRQYCSRRCSGLHQRKIPNRHCLICHKQFVSRPSVIKKGKGKYCSKICANYAKTLITGEQHPQYKRLRLNCVYCHQGFLVKPCNKNHQFCSKACRYMGASITARRLIGNKRPTISGENCHLWKGGIIPIRKFIRNSSEYKYWRQRIFERDNYTCQECGRRGIELHVDHKKPLAIIVEENNIRTTSEAVNCKELWDTNNGKTLCIPCHKETDTFGPKYFAW